MSSYSELGIYVPKARVALICCSFATSWLPTEVWPNFPKYVPARRSPAANSQIAPNFPGSRQNRPQIGLQSQLKSIKAAKSRKISGITKISVDNLHFDEFSRITHGDALIWYCNWICTSWRSTAENTLLTYYCFWRTARTKVVSVPSGIEPNRLKEFFVTRYDFCWHRPQFSAKISAHPAANANH